MKAQFTTGRTHRVIYNGQAQLNTIPYDEKVAVYRGKVLPVVEEICDDDYAIDNRRNRMVKAWQ